MTPEGLANLRSFERLVLHVYDDADSHARPITPWPGGHYTGHPTIGWGHCLTPSEIARGAYAGGITAEQAEALLRADLAPAEAAVDRLVRVPLTAHQRDALVDFAFNCGAERLASSTLLRRLNAGDYACIPGQLRLWVRAEHDPGGHMRAGLVRRRESEVTLWLMPDPEPAEAPIDVGAIEVQQHELTTRTLDEVLAEGRTVTVDELG